jgi:hypothetical protein
MAGPHWGKRNYRPVQEFNLNETEHTGSEEEAML